MDLVRFFLGQHAATHAGDVSGRAGRFDRLLGDLSDDQLRVRPGPELNSVVWLLWHMARTEDVAVNLVVAGPGTRSSASPTPRGLTRPARSGRTTTGSTGWVIPRGRGWRGATSSAAPRCGTTPVTSARR